MFSDPVSAVLQMDSTVQWKPGGFPYSRFDPPATSPKSPYEIRMISSGMEQAQDSEGLELTMDGKLKIVALMGAVLVAAGWTRAELETGNAATSPRLISVALSTPPQNPLPGGSQLPVANPNLVMYNTAATNVWAGTAWSGYFSEPYHYQCGGKTAAQLHGAGGCDAGGCDACGWGAGDRASSCHCVDRFLRNLTLFCRRCTVCDDLASCDSCDNCDNCDSCSSGSPHGSDPDDEEPPRPDGDSVELYRMPKPMVDPMPEPMDDPMPEPMDDPMPKLPAPVAPPRNPLPKSASRPLHASYQPSPQQPQELVLQPPQELAAQPPQRTRETQPGKTMLRFRMPAKSLLPPQQASSSLILLLGAEQH
jgi:hypothetical protein